MSYFSNFPNILYPFKLNGKITLIRVKDIALNVRVRKEIINNITLYDTYDIQDGDTPETIAEKLYGDAHLHWVIMLANDRYDFYNDFPLSSDALAAYIENKYGQGNEEDQHMLFGEPHFRDQNGNIVDGPATELITAVSNFQHEFEVNESKRRIKVLSPQVVANVVSEIAASFEGFEE